MLISAVGSYLCCCPRLAVRGYCGNGMYCLMLDDLAAISQLVILIEDLDAPVLPS
jgi:hypothetical protein